MFDVSFSELMLIGVIALIVIGPERLPKVARTIGHLVGRAQRYVSDVKSDIQREMDLDELNNLKGQMEEAAKSVKSSMQEASDSLRQPLSEAEQALKEASASVESLVDSARAQMSGPETTAAPAAEPAKPAAAPATLPTGNGAAAPSAGADIQPAGTAGPDTKDKPGAPT
ncbi:MAG: Sec-independent protein translocase protein TatB [Alcaligenaceae bacterium]|nr:Sec-independent protein translocase protein TatB [Alcaligenaceae bacterium]